jgi:hypothetical protein
VRERRSLSWSKGPLFDALRHGVTGTDRIEAAIKAAAEGRVLASPTQGVTEPPMDGTGQAARQASKVRPGPRTEC